MTKPFSLQTVLELMQTRTDDAARELGKRIAQEHDARKQLEMLEDYRREYVNRFQAAAQAGMAPGQWQNYQVFIGKLDEAIGQQRAAVTRSQNHTVAGQQAWLEQRNRLKAIDALSERHFERERALESRRDQKFTDELTARRHATGSPGDGN